MNPTNPSPANNVYNPLEAMRPGEEIICEIKRNPIGLFGAYIAAAIVIIAALTAALLAPSYLDTITQQTKVGIVLTAVLIMIVTLLYVYIATSIYTANRWIVTSDSITQIAQSGLASTVMSQLSLDDLEDITVEQRGLTQTFFGYGTLHAETAGEHSKFVFPYCPNPDACARKILAAREAFEAKDEKKA